MADGFKPILARLVEGQPLTSEQAHDFFAACLRGEPTPSQVAAAVTALRIRGETVDEIAAFAAAMREAALTLDHPYEVIDTCGTGGDGHGWYRPFREDARQVLLAELDLRFQPVDALLAALRPSPVDA